MSVYSVAEDGICIYDFPATRRVLDRFSVTGHVNMTIDLCRGICDSKSSRFILHYLPCFFNWLFSDFMACRMEMSVIVAMTTRTFFQPTSISATRHAVATVMKRVVDHGE